MRPTQEPTVTERPDGIRGKEIVFSHPAYGVVRLSNQSGGSEKLFGTDLKHQHCMSLTISPAQLIRGDTHDNVFGSHLPIIEITLSHTQFAELITTPNRGEGVPCTINSRDGMIMPGIVSPETRAEVDRREVLNSARKAVDQAKKIMGEIEVARDAGKGKKEMNALFFNLKCTLDNLPANLEYAVETAERTVDKAVSDAKMEFETYVDKRIHQLGMDAASAQLLLLKP